MAEYIDKFSFLVFTNKTPTGKQPHHRNGKIVIEQDIPAGEYSVGMWPAQGVNDNGPWTGLSVRGQQEVIEENKEEPANNRFGLND